MERLTSLLETRRMSAGVGNQYGHPHKAAASMFGRLAQKWYSTNGRQGQSLRTVADGTDVKAYLFKV